MKRSDMIESIVYHCLSWDGLDTSGVPKDEIANDILTHLEKTGMKPPCLPDKYCQALLDVYIEPNFNQWEEKVEEDIRVMERVKKREE